MRPPPTYIWSVIPPVLFGSVVLLLALTAHGSDEPLSEKDLRSVLGCYQNGPSLVKVDKNAVTVFNGRQVTTSESAKFRYYRRYAVVTDLNIVFNYRTNVIEASRSDHELIDLFRGPKEKRFLEIHSANYDEKGQDRYISLYRRACRPVT